MKKIISLASFLLLIAVGSFAQSGPGDRFQKKTGAYNKSEKFEGKKDYSFKKRGNQHFSRTGTASRFEKRKFKKGDCNSRRHADRFRHKGRR